MSTQTRHWLSLVLKLSLVLAVLLLAYEVQQNNRLLRQQAEYVHVQNKLESNEHFIRDPDFRKVFLKAETQPQTLLADSEIVLIYSYHFNTYLKWQWEWRQLNATNPEAIPMDQWGSYLRVYPLTLEAWEWRKSHFMPEFVRFFEETLEPDSRRVE